MAENTIIRTRYKYRPDNSDKYVTVHFETSADIVQTPDLSEFGITKGTSVTDVIKYLINDLIKTRALVPVCNTHNWFVLNNPILGNGQMGYETDTCRIKMGNGVNPYNMIKYAAGGSGSSGEDGVVMEVIADRKQSLDNINPIIPANTYVVETDTHQIKLGDGKTSYKDLPYIEAKMVSSSYNDTDNKIGYDYASNLNKTNEVLEKGQYVYEVDTGKVKIGDGKTKYNDLPYIDNSTMKVEDLVGSDPVVKTDEIMVLHDELGYTVRQGDGTTVFSELPEIKLLAIDEANKEYEFEYFTDDSGEEVDGSTFTGLLMVDTYENFSKVNPVLLDGQIAICEQSIVGCKMGDGKTTFNALRANSLILTDTIGTEFDLDGLLNDEEVSLISSNSGDLLSTNNPILNNEEQLVYVNITRISKIGDGTTKFLDLPNYEPGMVTDGKIVYYDSSANFILNNPTLSKDTLGIESDTNKIKIGDGVNAWTALDYAKNM